MVEVNHQSETDIRVGASWKLSIIARKASSKRFGWNDISLVPRRIASTPASARARHPRADFAVGQRHRVTTGQQNFSQFLAARFRVTPTVRIDNLVVRFYVVGNFRNLGQALSWRQCHPGVRLLSG